MTRDDLIAVLERTTDPVWLAGIRDDPDSEALLDAMMDTLVRVSDAVDRGIAATQISTAPGGRPGVVDVLLRRIDATFEVTIPKGFPFLTPLGTLLLVSADVVIPAAQTDAAVHLITVRKTELVNTEDDAYADLEDAYAFESPSAPEVLDGGGNVALGPPGTTVTDFLFFMVSSTPVTEGATDYLSAHGNERGQHRQPGESEEHYRQRIRDIPDVVSPIAIASAVRGVAAQVGLPLPTLLEPFQDGSGSLLDAALGLGNFGALYCDADFCDDPTRQLVSRREACAYFLLQLNAVPADPSGLRPFFDGSTFFDDPVWGYADVQDEPQLLAGLMAMWEEANRKRAACVQFDILIPAKKVENGFGATINGAPTVVWVLTPPAGKVWLLVYGFFGHNPNPPGVSHSIRFDYDDATFGVTPDYSGPDAQVIERKELPLYGGGPEKRITSITGTLTSNGIDLVSLLGSAWVIEVSA